MGRTFVVRPFLWADEMSRSLGVLTLDLIAKTSNFEQGMDRAGRRVRSTADEMEAARRTADRYVMAIGAAGVAFASAAAAMAVSAAKSMDATAKMAQQVGTTTEALTGMRFAAQQFANISDQQFDMSMRRMTRRIAEAAEGSGAAKGALDAMGLSARQLAQLAPEKQMLAIAEAMHRTERQADRLRYTMAIFDTEGMALVPALQQGAAAFEQNIEVARRFGVVLSTEAAQAAEQFTSNMSLLNSAQQGFKQQVAESLLPTLADLSDRLVELSERVGPMGEVISTALKAAGVAALATATIFTSRLIASIAKTGAAWLAATASAARYQMQMSTLASAIAGTNRALTASTAALAGSMAVMSRAGQLALGVLGGPVGLVATIGLTAAGFLAMGRDARTASVDIDELSESFKTLSAQKLELRMFDLEDEVKRLEDQTRESGEILAGVEKDVRDVYESAARGVNITAEELENARRALLEQREAHATNNAELDRARTLLNQVIDHLERMRGAAHGAAGGVLALNEAMTNEAGKTYLERLADQAITAGLKTQREQLEALVAAGKLVYTPEDLEKARKHADHIDRMSAAYKGASSAAKEFESSVKSLISAHLPEVKATEDLHKNLATLQAAQKAGIVTGQNYVKALESINKAYAKQVNDLLPESTKKAQEQVKAAKEQQKQLQLQLRTFGLAESAVLALAAADTDSAIAKLEAAKANEIANGETTERIKHIEAEIQVLRELRDLQLGSAGLQGQLEWREQQRQQWEDWSRDVEQIFDRVGQSLTDAIFEGGKSAKDLLRDLFKSLTFNVLINPVMNQMQGWVTSQLGGMFGVQNPQQQRSGGGFSFGGGSTFGAGGVEMAGDWLLRSGLAPETGAKMLMNADAIAKVGGNILGYGKAIYDLAQGNYGSAAGTAIGTYLLPGPGTVIGSVLGGLVDDLFGDDKPKTRHAQMAHAELMGDGRMHVSTRDSRQSEEVQVAAAKYAEESIKAAQGLFDQIGIDAEFTRFVTLMESSILGDKQGVGSSGTIRIGDLEHEIGLAIESSWTKHGFGGWSDAEMFPRLQTDIQLTLLEAFQVAGDALPSVLSDMLEGVDIRSLGAEQAQALAQEFAAVVEQVSSLQAALEQLPFENLRDLSFDAAANLIQFAGSLEALESGMATYFQNFYSQEEQLAFAAEQMTDAFADLGFTMPDLSQGAEAAKSAYRALVESLDVTTEEGQKAYVTLMTLSGGFSELVTGLDELAAATARAAEEAARAAEQAARSEYERLARVGEYQLQAAISQLNAAWSAVQHHAQQEISRLEQTFSQTDSLWNAYQSRVRSLESELGGLLTTISRGVADLRGQVDATAQMQYAQARAVISTALVTGHLPQTADLTEAMRVAQQGVAAGRYGSAFEQREAYLKLAAEMEALQGIAQPELDAAQTSLEMLEKQFNRLRGIESISDQSLSQLERQLAVAFATEEAARTQIAAIEGQLAWAERQYNALLGIGSGITNLASAFRAFQVAAGAVRDAQSNPVNRDQQYLNAKLDQLRRENPYYGGIDWTTATVSDLAAFFRKEGLTPEQHYRLHGRYEGLSYDTGTSYVPRDMLANIHQGEIIIDPRSSDILRRYGIGVQGGGSKELVAEMRQLRAEVSGLRAEQKSSQFAIAKHTQKTARLQEKWDAIGMPHEQAEVSA